MVIALAHMVKYLSKFDISRVFRKQTRFKQFTERNHMLLNANTLTNLCVTHTTPLPSWLIIADAAERYIATKPIIK